MSYEWQPVPGFPGYEAFRERWHYIIVRAPNGRKMRPSKRTGHSGMFLLKGPDGEVEIHKDQILLDIWGVSVTCAYCGKEFKIVAGSRRMYCSPECSRKSEKRKSNRYRQSSRNMGLGKRKCHDCGKPTTDYRCPRCRSVHLAKWRESGGGGFYTEDEE